VASTAFARDITVDQISNAEYGPGGWSDVKKRDTTVDQISDAEYGGGWSDVKKREAIVSIVSDVL
jgi:hypothetical protein